MRNPGNTLSVIPHLMRNPGIPGREIRAKAIPTRGTFLDPASWCGVTRCDAVSRNTLSVIPRYDAVLHVIPRYDAVSRKYPPLDPAS